MEKELRVLMIEDVLADAELEVRELKRAGLHVAHRVVDTEGAFRDALREFQPDLIISDFSMPHFDGMWALALARELAPDVPFIFVSGTIGEEYAIRALKNGATDYVLKDNLVRLPAAVERSLDEARQRALRAKLERELNESNSRFRLLVESVKDYAILALDLAGRVVSWNSGAKRVKGYEAEEILGKHFSIFYPEGDSRERCDEMLRTVSREGSKEWEGWRVRKDGNRFWASVIITSIVGEDGKLQGYSKVTRDITERRQQEEKIARLSRIKAVLSGINSAIVRIRDRQQLFNEACRIAVEHGGFAIAWIGEYDPQLLEVTPIATAGLEGDYHLMHAKLALSPGSPTRSGMIATAIRDRQPVFSNDITLEPEVGGQRRQEAIKRGYRSVIALPLQADGSVVGTLSLLSREPGFFDDEEMKLLTELAGDISFALEHMARQEKIEKLSRIRAVSSEINATIVRIRERDALLQETCRIAAEHGKFEMIWIGTLDALKQQIRPIAWTGFSDEIARRVSWQSVSAAQGTLSEAIRTRKPAVRNDIEVQLPAGGMRNEAMNRGCRSTICLPLVVDDSVVALIVLFAAGTGYFDEDELALLREVAADVSFALDRMAKQDKVEKLSRIRAVMSEINAAIVRIRDRQLLFDEACRIASEHGKFTVAWIGALDRAAREVLPVAWIGLDAELLASLRVSVGTEGPESRGTISRSLRSKQPEWENDFEADPVGGYTRAQMIQRGYFSAISLPLLVDGEVDGVFVLYASERGFFTNEEVAMLTELGADVSFALQSISKQQRLDYLSYYDPLTGLPNRALYVERLGQRLEAASDGEKVVVMLGDVQRLRMINETLGRQAGDEVLKQIAGRLADFVHNRESLARINADCFATFLHGVKDLGEVAHHIARLRVESLRNTFRIAGRELTLTFTLGAAVYPGDGKDAESLLANAEAALRKAKAAGESLLFYEPSINARVAESLNLENKLRRALDKDQFVLHYQPKVDLASGRISGLEALIRWNDPATGLVPPMKFIPLLEETGMILDAGRWALCQALRDYREWAGRGLQPPRIAVNVSPIQLRQKDFVDVVRDAIGSTGSHGLDLEVTESLAMEDIAGNIATLRAIREMGVQIAIDDFGTGYSSLGYLAILPVNTLKIDRSFIITMAKEPDSMTIVSAIISLAHSLNLTVVAEGVDSEDQRKILRLLKCDEIQGYLFSKPLPAAEIEPLLRAPA